MKNLKLKGAKFLMVGGFTTAVDFLVFNVVTAFGLGIIPGNMLSTTCGLFLGFFLHRRFVFGHSTEAKFRQFATFVAVTMFSIYAIQSLVIFVVTRHWTLPVDALSGVAELFGVTALFGEDVVLRNSAKVFAGMTTALLNFFTYSEIVFRSEKERRAETRNELGYVAKLIGAFRW